MYLKEHNARQIDPVRIGKRLREERIKRGLSINQAAVCMDYGRPNLSRAELGKHSLSLRTLADMATFYGLTVADLLYVEEDAQKHLDFEGRE